MNTDTVLTTHRVRPPRWRTAIGAVTASALLATGGVAAAGQGATAGEPDEGSRVAGVQRDHRGDQAGTWRFQPKVLWGTVEGITTDTLTIDGRHGSVDLAIDATTAISRTEVRAVADAEQADAEQADGTSAILAVEDRTVVTETVPVTADQVAAGERAVAFATRADGELTAHWVRLLPEFSAPPVEEEPPAPPVDEEPPAPPVDEEAPPVGDGIEDEAPEPEQARAQGVITDIDGATFELEQRDGTSLTVTTDDETEVRRWSHKRGETTDVAALEVGDRVKVQGTVADDGAMAADVVKVRGDRGPRHHGKGDWRHGPAHHDKSAGTHQDRSDQGARHHDRGDHNGQQGDGRAHDRRGKGGERHGR